MEQINRWREKSLNKFIPMQATLELTYRCNERCTHCYIDSFTDNKQRLLSLSQWEIVIQKLRAAGTLYIVLIGGEPMLSPVFWDVVGLVKKYDLHCSIITNGQLIDNAAAERMKSSGVDYITFSLYSMNSFIHDQMTSVNGSHAKLMQAIQYIKEQGIQIGINCLLTKNNIEGYFELEDWCIANGYQLKEDVNITPKFNGDITPTKLRATSEQLTTFYTIRTQKWPNSLPRPIDSTENDYVCNIAKGKCAITAYGDVLGCVEVRKTLGNLIDSEFSTIWNNEETNYWRNLKNSDLIKKDLGTTCGTGDFCDHCLGVSQHEIGNHLTITQDAIRIAKVKKDVYLNLKND